MTTLGTATKNTGRDNERRCEHRQRRPRSGDLPRTRTTRRHHDRGASETQPSSSIVSPPRGAVRSSATHVTALTRIDAKGHLPVVACPAGLASRHGFHRRVESAAHGEQVVMAGIALVPEAMDPMREVGRRKLVRPFLARVEDVSQLAASRRSVRMRQAKHHEQRKYRSACAHHHRIPGNGTNEGSRPKFPAGLLRRYPLKITNRDTSRRWRFPCCPP